MHLRRLVGDLLAVASWVLFSQGDGLAQANHGEASQVAPNLYVGPVSEIIFLKISSNFIGNPI
jgi:hypothetical protein